MRCLIQQIFAVDVSSRPLSWHRPTHIQNYTYHGRICIYTYICFQVWDRVHMLELKAVHARAFFGGWSGVAGFAQ